MKNGPVLDHSRRTRGLASCEARHRQAALAPCPAGDARPDGLSRNGRCRRGLRIVALADGVRTGQQFVDEEPAAPGYRPAGHAGALNGRIDREDQSSDGVETENRRFAPRWRRSSGAATALRSQEFLLFRTHAIRAWSVIPRIWKDELPPGNAERPGPVAGKSRTRIRAFERTVRASRVQCRPGPILRPAMIRLVAATQASSYRRSPMEHPPALPRLFRGVEHRLFVAKIGGLAEKAGVRAADHAK